MDIKELLGFLKCEKVEFKELGELCELRRGRVISKNYLKDNAGKYPVYSSQTQNNGIFGYINSYDFEGEFVSWTTDGANAGSVFYINEQFSVTNVCGLLNKKIDSINMRFLYFVLSITAKNYVNWSSPNPKLMSNKMAKIKIPVPPLEIQHKIVEILDAFTELQAELQAELHARRKQYEYYRNALLSFESLEKRAKAIGGGLKLVSLGEIGKRNAGTKITANQMQALHKEKAPVRIFAGGSTIADVDYRDLPKKDVIDKPSIICKARGYIGFEYYDKPFSHKSEFWSYTIDKNANQKFIYYFLVNQQEHFQKLAKANSVKIPQLKVSNTDSFKIPLPPLEVQNDIVEILDAFDALANDLSAGLPAEIEARKKQYEYYRERLLSFSPSV